MIRKVWPKRLAVITHDIVWIPVSVVLAFWLRFNLGLIPVEFVGGMRTLALVALICHAATFWWFGCYRGIWRFASIPDVVRLGKAVVAGTLVVGVATFLINRFEDIPRSTMVLYPILLFLAVVSARVLGRFFFSRRLRLERGTHKKALIVGGGSAGNLLIKDLLDRGPFAPAAVVDDDPGKQGTDLHGVRVMGMLADIPRLIGQLEIEAVLVAMPSAPRRVMDELIRVCSEHKIPCRTLPSLAELADGRVEVSRLRPVTLEDLLGREPVELDREAIAGYLAGQTVVVTGGGGSIGAELCRQIVSHEPDRLVILENSEFNLYRIERELLDGGFRGELVPALGDVRARDYVANLFRQFRPDAVFHAAAYKHVPIVEENVVAAIGNNVLGTRVVADCAAECGVSKFVLVSTDKTVNPTNVMGATKRVAEVYCQALDERVATDFITTRFGNVLGSAGSVVPLFRRQVEAGGPVTVTHPEITRYFMTIAEAAALILQAGAMGRGGEIFVLDMGKPVRIRELAENLIRMSGFRPGADIAIEYCGLRPGEKMEEELFYRTEERVGTGHPKLLLAKGPVPSWPELASRLEALEAAVRDHAPERALEAVQELVPEFRRFVPEEKPGARRGQSDHLRVLK